MRTAKELLDALASGRGSAQAGDSGGGSQVSPQATGIYENNTETAGFPALIDFKIAENAVF
jgi:hypothetical protein